MQDFKEGRIWSVKKINSHKYIMGEKEEKAEWCITVI